MDMHSSAPSTFAGVRCPVCATVVGAERHLCPRCDTPHHPECFEYAGGCAIFGCSAMGQSATAVGDEALARLEAASERWIRGARRLCGNEARIYLVLAGLYFASSIVGSLERSGFVSRGTFKVLLLGLLLAGMGALWRTWRGGSALDVKAEEQQAKADLERRLGVPVRSPTGKPTARIVARLELAPWASRLVALFWVFTGVACMPALVSLLSSGAISPPSSSGPFSPAADSLMTVLYLFATKRMFQRRAAEVESIRSRVEATLVAMKGASAGGG